MDPREITRRALAMSEVERVELARLLIESLSEQSLIAEGVHRIEEIAQGKLTPFSAEAFQALTETEYLLSSPANAKRLREAIKDLEDGKGTQISLKDLEKA